ncbi:MAG: hypothetical protein M3Q74_05630 [Pseudomonadota bacterium]|nr:hypothetical protein [Pseudomonadota bacterium]
MTALFRAPEQNGIIDIRKAPRPSPKPPAPTQWEKAWKAVGKPISDFWPLAAVQSVRKFRRHNDRMIAKWLWLDYPPKR